MISTDANFYPIYETLLGTVEQNLIIVPSEIRVCPQKINKI